MGADVELAVGLAERMAHLGVAKFCVGEISVEFLPPAHGPAVPEEMMVPVSPENGADFDDDTLFYSAE